MQTKKTGESLSSSVGAHDSDSPVKEITRDHFTTLQPDGQAPPADEKDPPAKTDPGGNRSERNGLCRNDTTFASCDPVQGLQDASEIRAGIVDYITGPEFSTEYGTVLISEIEQIDNLSWSVKTDVGIYRVSVHDDVYQVESLEVNRLSEAATLELYADFMKSPTHGLASDILYNELSSMVIFELFENETQRNGRFWIRKKNQCFFEPADYMQQLAREILESAINLAFEGEAATATNIKELYSRLGTALQKARTRDFLRSAVQLFSERVTVKTPSWNGTAMCLPTQTGILDFSGKSIIKRKQKPGEHWRDPLPYTAEEILQAGDTEHFDEFLKTLFPDPDTRKSALHCLSLCVANKGNKVFQVWVNHEGNAGKNTLMDVLGIVLQERIQSLSGAIITVKGDASERRFGMGELEGATGAFFDEVGDTFHINQVKRLTSLSHVKVERKGRNPHNIPATWATVAMCNTLPKFYPATDGAFIDRLFVLPFRTVFYVNEDSRERYRKTGVSDERLKPAKDKSELTAALKPESAGILYKLIVEYMDMRDNCNGRPVESSQCKAAKEDYRTTNDTIESFILSCLDVQDSTDNQIIKYEIEYSELKDLYDDFVGHSKVNIRTIVNRLMERLGHLQRSKRAGKTYLQGIQANMGGDNDSLPF